MGITQTTNHEEGGDNMFLRRRKKPLSTSRKKSLTPDIQASDEEDNETAPTIEEIISLRKLKKSRGGIELEKLNAGEPRKKKKKKNSKANTDNLGEEDTEKYGLQKDEDIKKDESDHEDEESRAKKLIKANNFTQQTNTLDVDKHMMRYIEEELQNRRKAAIASGADESTEPILKGLDAVASLDPRDELYKIAENYRIERKPVVEGNVTLSATMLTSIPEVDLGIDTRIKNIEATEKAKRMLTEQRTPQTQQQNSDSREHFAADRFLLPNHLRQHAMPELETLQIAKLEKEGSSEEAEAMRRELKRKAYQLKYGNNNNQNGSNYRPHGSKYNQVATDDRAVEIFRKRLGGRR
ncbi:hepatocellular carcinoma-associated antigen 59-domain-containing protein [Phakopsora pachyrhizi]|uniref:Hepatocellular carcinoma-associated antigen 59-domain-containing protein n=1 Tax=Phakopsora pachyrhizi TaxID=170000 RepID=A0AAV0BN40_PHAPC|nr:hepatocellular carcinoma-associated antigen 59-domain-containing protein [Phakopsora pachyrhizi]CAH7687610.1 hepatocellular carcinoma-associated antigen 59-domain-containing protein [Phakopsora pachyrhizi]